MAWMRFQISQHIKTAGMPVSVDVLFPEHRKNNCEKVKTLYRFMVIMETGQTGCLRRIC